MVLGRKFLFQAAVALTCCAAFMSCAQVKVPAEISQRLQGAKDELLRSRVALVETNKALANLKENKGADLRPQFDAYEKALETLDAKAGGTGWVADMANAKNEQYFTNWENQVNSISDKDLREAGEQRRKQAMEEYAKLRELGADLRSNFRPYMGTLVDIRTSLKADLTQQGLSKAEPTIKKAIDGEDSILKKLDAVAKQIDSMTAH